jgi:TolA-binding protein
MTPSDELKARLGKKQTIEDMQAAQQRFRPVDVWHSAGGGPASDVLYNNALRDYQAANYLAAQEFADYVKYYPNTDLAGN